MTLIVSIMACGGLGTQANSKGFNLQCTSQSVAFGKFIVELVILQTDPSYVIVNGYAIQNYIRSLILAQIGDRKSL